MRAAVYWVKVEGVRVAVLPRPRGGEHLEEELRSVREQGVSVLLSLLTPAEVAELELEAEERICGELGIKFASFPIEDRGVPGNHRAAVECIAALKSLHDTGSGVGIHYRYGVGRAPMVAAALLTALGTAAPLAFRAITEARGCPVPDTPHQGEWVTRICTERGGRSRP